MERKKKWGPVTEGLRISVFVPKRRFHVGEPVSVWLSMKNADKVSLRVVNRSPWIDYKLEVLPSGGGPLPLSDSAKRKMEALAESGRAVSELAPGAEISACLQLEEGYDISAPGVYRIKASREIYRKGSQSQFATVVSLAVEFEVTPI